MSLMAEPSKTTSGVIWITGLSGSGKTFLANRLILKYRSEGHIPIHLDGDDLRFIFESAQKYDSASRLNLAKMYSRLAKLLASQGHLVIVSTISLFHEIHELNRQTEFYCEIYIESDESSLKKRNSRSVYKNSDGSETIDVVGNDISAELPISPHRTVSINFDNPLSPDIDELFNFTFGFLSNCSS